MNDFAGCAAGMGAHSRHTGRPNVCDVFCLLIKKNTYRGDVPVIFNAGRAGPRLLLSSHTASVHSVPGQMVFEGAIYFLYLLLVATA